MGRCSNAALISKVGIPKIDRDSMEIDFAVLTDLNNCIRVNTRDYTNLGDNTSASYNKYRVPEDAYNCLAEGCRNSGTLMISPTGSETFAAATFRVNHDAADFFAGVATFYLYFEAAGTYEFVFSIGETDLRYNFDIYKRTFEVDGPGFRPVVIDFSVAPEQQDGSGWEVSEMGASFLVKVTRSDSADPFTVGISSLYFYSSFDEFEINDVVKLACLSEIAGDLTVDPTDASCWGATYDSTSVSVERTITGGRITPNYWKLNPLIGRGEETTGWEIISRKSVVKATTVNGIEYGYVQFTDMNLQECAFTTAVIADQCNVTDSMLNRVSMPTPVSLGERQFIVLDGTQTEIIDKGKILFNPALVGMKVAVSYPRTVNIEQYVANESSLAGRRTRMSFVVPQTDGVRIQYVYNNVLITSFPMTINGEETSFAFTISIQKDRNGNFFEMNRIVE